MKGEEDESDKVKRCAKVHVVHGARVDNGLIKDISRQKVEAGDKVKVKMGRPREKWSGVLTGIVMKIESEVNKILIKLETGAYYWRRQNFVRYATESGSGRKGIRYIRSTHWRSDEPCPRTMNTRGGGHE